MITNHQTPSKDEITVIIPTLNEALAIGKVIDELKQKGFTKMLVVDGHSTDGTPEITRLKGVEVVAQDGKGKADAIKSVLQLVDTKYLLVMDGDNTYDPNDVENMIKIAEDNDEVIVARIGGKKNIPLLNRLGNGFITGFFNLLFGTELKDVLSGMYLLKTDVGKDLWFEFRGFSLEVEMAAHVATTSRKITNVNGNYRSRLGKAKLGKTQGLTILRDIISLALRYNPTFVILAAGSFFILPAVIILSYVVISLLFLGVNHFVWAIMGVTVGGVGIISLLLSIMALYIKRMEYRMIERLNKFTNNNNHNGK
ncbi:MAG: glycosyltransferase family 2 protein [Nitrososphaeria archaeon]|jgi:dolichol-phosphate mannosyltransferase